MSELTYPREWFSSDRWSDVPKARMFDKETTTRLYYRDRGSNRFVIKMGSYQTWHPTIEEAQAVIDERLAREVAAKADRRIRDAAPELLEALETFQQHVIRNACTWTDAESGSHHHPVWQQVASAIAKARGQA